MRILAPVQDDDARYRALLANDRRFDGLFFVGISTTGIYCRPVCPARKARRSSCTFFPSAAAAEESGYRPCLRCRPELAPTSSPYEQRFARAAAVVAHIQAGGLNGENGLDELASFHGMSVRQLRRVVGQATGVSPVQLAQTARLLLAKQLLTETKLTVTNVAFASGFASLRRFNEVFRASYRMAPSRFRKGARSPRGEAPLELLVAYRPPLQWDELLRFLSARAIQGVEQVAGQAYRRTASLGGCTGWVEVQPAARENQLALRLAPALTPVLQPLLALIRDVFDLHAEPSLVDEHLARTALLAPLVERRPGLRVPGAFDGFELAWRAVLGQQVSVRGATTLAGRFAARFGTPFETPFEGLSLQTPSATRVARATPEQVAKLGLPRTRAASLVALARLCRSTPALLRSGARPDATRERLLALPGIGPWTADYVAMRALHWPDAFPATDLGLRHALQARGVTPSREVAEPWRPWRSYAAMHLWAQLADT
jgi:AraC family transcriptional regulator of adaptative response / DNA-3-methyladenine glycosylase II